MRFDIVGKNIEVTPAMREKIEKKLSGFDKYLLIDDDVIARVVTRVYPNSQKVEVTIPTKVGILRTEVENDDLYSAIDLAVDKLEEQLRRQKTRLEKRHRDSLAEAFLQQEMEAEEDIEVKTKSVHIEDMDLEEAIMAMELVGHTFFVYKDEETGQPAIVYKRHNGGYGLIEIDM